MAEDDVTPEQLAAIAAENEEPEIVNYKAPAQKTVQEIHEMDKDDESLRKYKEALLGTGVAEAGNAAAFFLLLFSGMHDNYWADMSNYDIILINLIVVLCVCEP